MVCPKTKFISNITAARAYALAFYFVMLVEGKKTGYNKKDLMEDMIMKNTNETVWYRSL